MSARLGRGNSPTRGVSPLQFFLAHLYSERLAGTGHSTTPRAGDSSHRSAEPARPTGEHDTATPAAAAAR
jgi:hypothetical protein